MIVPLFTNDDPISSIMQICCNMQQFRQVSAKHCFSLHFSLTLCAKFHEAKHFFLKNSMCAAIYKNMLQMCCKCSIIAFFQLFPFTDLRLNKLIACYQNSSHSKYKYIFSRMCSIFANYAANMLQYAAN